MDGEHVEIKQPGNNGYYYFSYKRDSVLFY